MDEGYVFREWEEAVTRSQGIIGRRFVVPVVVDENYDNDVDHYRHIPDYFRRLHFGHAPLGEPDANLRNVFIAEIRSMRSVAFRSPT